MRYIRSAGKYIDDKRVEFYKAKKLNLFYVSITLQASRYLTIISSSILDNLFETKKDFDLAEWVKYLGKFAIVNQYTIAAAAVGTIGYSLYNDYKLHKDKPNYQFLSMSTLSRVLPKAILTAAVSMFAHSALSGNQDYWLNFLPFSTILSLTASYFAFYNAEGIGNANKEKALKDHREENWKYNLFFPAVTSVILCIFNETRTQPNETLNYLWTTRLITAILGVGLSATNAFLRKMIQNMDEGKEVADLEEKNYDFISRSFGYALATTAFHTFSIASNPTLDNQLAAKHPNKKPLVSTGLLFIVPEIATLAYNLIELISMTASNKEVG